MENNHRLYAERREPACLVIKKGVDYINVRTCQDRSVLERVLDELEAFGDDAVLVPWLSPPFLDTVGYGMYTISESKEMRQLEKKERWVFPCLGPRYDREYFCDRIASICK